MTELLWLMRELPEPVDSGDRRYSRGLVCGLAEAGHAITVLAPADARGADLSALPEGIKWRRAAAQPNGRLVSLLGPLPLVAQRFDTPANRQAVEAALAENPRACVVLDNYCTVWALPQVLAAGRRLVVVAHNDETRLARDIWRDYRGNPLKKLALWLNARKVAKAEARLISKAELVVTITPSDAAAMWARGAKAVVTAAPGYTGPRDERPITEATPRNVVLFGSFGWVAKQMNLRAFLDAADAPFAERGIHLDVVGAMPKALQAELQPRLRATTLHGFVDDPGPVLRRARIGVVPEATGGGFKLKTLDYLFSGVVVAGLRPALEGLPGELDDALFACPDMDALVATVCEVLDDVDRLERMRSQALSLADRTFRWTERCAALSLALDRLPTGGSTPGH